MNGTEANLETGKEIFIQDYVSVDSVSPNLSSTVNLSDDEGCLIIIEYPEPLGTCIEWRHGDYEQSTRESEDSGWEIVFDGRSERRTRTRSETSTTRKAPSIQLEVKKLSSFKVSKSRYQITLTQKDGMCKFRFRRGAVDFFAGQLKSIVPTTQSRNDSKLYLVSDKKNLEMSFAQLDMFPNDLPDSGSSTWQRFHERPFEATMNAFSKVNLKYFYNGGEEDSVINERLSSSLQHEELAPTREEYEVVTQKITLPPRVLKPRISPLTPEQWATFFNADGIIKTSEDVKKIVFNGGVDPTIRKEVWMFLLGVYPWESSLQEREKIHEAHIRDYNRMKTQWETISKEQEDRFSDFKERKSLIEKDVSRTDRTMNFYGDDNSRNLDQLRDILMTYVMYNFDLGYVQGMSDILSPIFFLIQDEVDSFWCFAAAVERMMKNFDIDQAGMKEQLKQLFQLLTILEPEMAEYLHKQESSNMFFCFRWLLVWFKREFTFDDIYILWETIWAQDQCLNYQLLICLAILDTEKEQIMTNEYGFTEILKHINELSNKIDLCLTLQKAEGIYSQLSIADNIPNTTRSILGLPLGPEPEEPEKATEALTNGTNHGTETFYSVGFCTNTEELAYETSINLAYH